MEYEYNNKMAPGGREPHLILIHKGIAREFTGKGIEGICVVLTEEYDKNGKWSNTTYRLELAVGVRPYVMMARLHGSWGDDLGSWGEVCSELSLPVDEAQRLVRGLYPRTAKRLDSVEEFALAQEELGLSSEEVVISFGSPTNKSYANGFWEEPKSAYLADGETLVTVAPHPEREWAEPTCMSHPGAQIVGTDHRPGRNGGFRTVTVAVPIGGEPAPAPEPEQKPEPAPKPEKIINVEVGTTGLNPLQQALRDAGLA
jgi:hypothetical protein